MTAIAPSAAREAPSLGQPLPIPSDFPVEWASPSQARQLWMLDRMHFGSTVLPLVADLYQKQVAAGINRTSERYNLPISVEFLYLNGYLYNANPIKDLPPESVQKLLNRLSRLAPPLYKSMQSHVVKGMTAKYWVHVEPMMATLDRQWQQSWLPELQQHLDFWHSFDLAGASLDELLTHLDVSLNRIERLWALHFEILVPAVLAISQFLDEYRPLFDGDGAAGDAFFPLLALLQEINHSFLDGDQALWHLSRLARSMPIVRQTIEQNPAPSVLSELSKYAEGQIFCAELCVWLDKYGQRGHEGDGLSGKSWIEDPTPVIYHLQENLASPDQDRLTEIQAQAADRQQRIAQARRRLQEQSAASSTSALDRFDSQLKAAQWGEFLLTEHNFWIDQQAMYCLRLLLIEIGRRCQQIGLINREQDLFYLSLDELYAMARSSRTLPRQPLIAERKAQLDYFRTLMPADALGTMPWLAPPDEPFARAMSRLFGRPLIPTQPVHQRQISLVRGQAASPGKVRGTARLIRTLDEADRLQRGEILVTTATLPPWTPLIAIAGGVVTDVGGILCHAAIIAREYGIPAVVATAIATETIQDGQLLEVDGSAGVVHLL